MEDGRYGEEGGSTMGKGSRERGLLVVVVREEARGKDDGGFVEGELLPLT